MSLGALFVLETAFTEPEAAAEATGWDCFGSFEAYPEEPTFRGVAAAAAFQPFDDFGSSFDESCFDSCDAARDFDSSPLPLDMHTFGLAPCTSFDKDLAAAGKPAHEFNEARGAPPLPLDPLFRVERSTVFVSDSVSAAALANRLLDFLDHNIMSSVKKVSEAKLAVTADVFVKGVMCTLKVRVYRRGGHHDHAVQFQRRQGCSFVFDHVYREAMQHLRDGFGSAAKEPSWEAPEVCSELPPPSELPLTDLPEPLPMDGLALDIGPLLEMAHCKREPGLQAEAAAALASADESILEQLCECEGLAALESLLRAEQLEVACPTAMLLSRLTSKPEAVKILERRGSLQLQTCGMATSGLLRQEFDKALGAAVKA